MYGNREEKGSTLKKTEMRSFATQSPSQATVSQSAQPLVNHSKDTSTRHGYYKRCDDRFSSTKLDFSRERTNGGGGWGISSVESIRLAKTETRHDFLAHGDLLRASLYGHQGGDSVLVPQ